MRKLASIRTIESVHEIPDAQKIEMVIIDGWQVVSQKGNFKPGDKCVYFEIDACFEKDSVVGLSLPVDKVTRVHTEDKGYIEGFRIKTIKLRGQISQGYALPLSYFRTFKDINLDAEDLTFELDVLKYDKPEPIGGVGSAPAAGNFPTDYIKKTDQERCLSFDTPIQTEDGVKTIQELCFTKYTGKVLSKDLLTNTEVYKPVIGWEIQESIEEDWFEIETESGKRLLMTGNHPVYDVEKGAFVEASTLTIGTSLDLSL